MSRAEWRGGRGARARCWRWRFAAQTVGLQWTSPSRSGFLTSLYMPLTPLIVLVLYRTLPGSLGRPWRSCSPLPGSSCLPATEGLAAASIGATWLTLLSALTFAAHMVATGVFARAVSGGASHDGSGGGRCAFYSSFATPLFETPAPDVDAISDRDGCIRGRTCQHCAHIRLQLAAQQVLSATYAALVYSLEPVVALGASLLLTGDRLSPMQSVGGFLIVIGSSCRSSVAPPQSPTACYG